MSGSSPGPASALPEDGMRIGELARATGATPRMLRYYEQQGLLRSRRDGAAPVSGHRRYDADAIGTVIHIRALLSAGVPTALVYDLLPCVEGPGPRLQRCAAPVLREQLQRIQEQVSSLRHAEQRLREVIEASSHE